MRKYISILCAMLVAALTSCNNNDFVSETDGTTQQVILQVTPDQGLNTRAAATGVDRFAIEVYSDATYTTAANVFEGSKNATTSSNGTFTMTLDKNQEYHCLLWADKAGAEVYDLASLKAVTLKSGKAPVEAWQGKLDIAKGTNGTLSATLTRSVAKITLLETGKLDAGTMIMTFEQNTVFDVSAGITKTEGDRTESISFAAIGTAIPTGSKLNASDIFVLASTVDADQPTLTFQITGETDKIEVSNVPLKANYNTNIKGHYSKKIAASTTTFTITCDDTWGTPDNDKDVEEVIDYIEVNGIKVAEGNLVADGANGAKIGEPTDKGLYFQFGSLVGWSSEGAPTIAVKPNDCNVASWSDSWTGASDPSANPDAKDEVAGTGDPCRYYLKGTWRLPTGAELGKLFENNGYPSSGPWMAEGDFFKGSNSYAVHTSGLKIPASGYRYFGDGSLDGVGSTGFYWSASPDANDFGSYLFLTDSDAMPSDDNGRADGFSVRCVRD